MEAAAATLSLVGSETGYEAAAQQIAEAGAMRAILTDLETAPQRLGRHWLGLAQNASEPNIFLESWFVCASVRHLDLPQDLQLIEIWNGQSLTGLLPVCGARGYARLPVRYVANWLHHHNFLGTPLIRAGLERAFWRAALQLLDENRVGSFLHATHLVEEGPVHLGLIEAARDLGRPCEIVHRFERALLQSHLSATAYYEQTVRKKKRKELKRLSARLAELGMVESRTLESVDELQPWCDEFLELERSGWKGEGGSALGCEAGTAVFFREAVAGAFRTGKLKFLRLDLEGRPLAMLVNFLAPPGSFSFKIAIDEEYARFSPGVLIQIENLRIIERPEVQWMDSCAAENHPMINSLWGERRPLVRVTVPLAGALNHAAFRICRNLERASAAARELRNRSKQVQVTEDE